MKRIRTVRLMAAALGVAAVMTAAPTAVAPATAVDRAGVCTGEYHGDARLGPRFLPQRWQVPVGPLLRGWKRTGGLSDSAFLKKYWEGSPADGGWKYPPDDGFTRVNGRVAREPFKLRRGRRLDRFGSEYGSYLAPAGDRYARRALPPQSLDTRAAGTPCDYRVYRVVKPFWAWEGRVAPWFEQPGGGRQIKLDAVFLDPGQGQRLSVKWLLDHRYLAPDGR